MTPARQIAVNLGLGSTKCYIAIMKPFIQSERIHIFIYNSRFPDKRILKTQVDRFRIMELFRIRENEFNLSKFTTYKLFDVDSYNSPIAKGVIIKLDIAGEHFAKKLDIGSKGFI